MYCTVLWRYTQRPDNPKSEVLLFVNQPFKEHAYEEINLKLVGSDQLVYQCKDNPTHINENGVEIKDAILLESGKYQGTMKSGHRVSVITAFDEIIITFE